jgi:hypothetical protein
VKNCSEIFGFLYKYQAVRVSGWKLARITSINERLPMPTGSLSFFCATFLCNLISGYLGRHLDLRRTAATIILQNGKALYLVLGDIEPLRESVGFLYS